VSFAIELPGFSEEFAASAFIVFYKEGAAWKERAVTALFFHCHENIYSEPLGKVCHLTPVGTSSCLRKLEVLSAFREKSKSKTFVLE